MLSEIMGHYLRQRPRLGRGDGWGVDSLGGRAQERQAVLGEGNGPNPATLANGQTGMLQAGAEVLVFAPRFKGRSVWPGCSQFVVLGTRQFGCRRGLARWLTGCLLI